MMAERGITPCHTTILRWVQQYVPEFEKRWNHYARPVGDSWRVDETYVKFNEISGSPQIHRNQGTSENILMLRLELTHNFAKYHSLTRQQGRLNRTRPVQQPASSRNHLTQRQVPQTISDKVVPHQPASCRWHLDSRRCMQDRRWHPDQIASSNDNGGGALGAVTSWSGKSQPWRRISSSVACLRAAAFSGVSSGLSSSATAVAALGLLACSGSTMLV
jgi:hypothetical protein